MSGVLVGSKSWHSRLCTLDLRSVACQTDRTGWGCGPSSSTVVCCFTCTNLLLCSHLHSWWRATSANFLVVHQTFTGQFAAATTKLGPMSWQKYSSGQSPLYQHGVWNCFTRTHRVNKLKRTGLKLAVQNMYCIKMAILQTLENQWHQGFYSHNLPFLYLWSSRVLSGHSLQRLSLLSVALHGRHIRCKWITDCQQRHCIAA